jgi:hypothetical protein
MTQLALDPVKLPTPIAQVAQRLNTVGFNHGADTFLPISYIAESFLKALAATLVAGLRTASDTEAYRYEYELLHSDSLGPWNDTVRSISSYPLVNSLPPEFRPLTAWLTRKSPKHTDPGLDAAVLDCESILEQLGSDIRIGTPKRSVLDVLTMLVVIRSKTKAHGAQGIEFFHSANKQYAGVLRWILETCPALTWAWLFARSPTTPGPKQIILEGLTPHPMPASDLRLAAAPPAGVCILPTPTVSRRALALGVLLHTSADCHSFQFPNGNCRSDADYEFIDYSSGHLTRRVLHSHSLPPAQLPLSETHGTELLDVQSNVFGNLPSTPAQYVSRPRLERELEDRLRDRNHHIITLHGRGGAGKTHLALCVAHQIANLAPPRFDRILWFSARDMDLTPTGPKKVAPDVLSLDQVVRAYARLEDAPSTRDTFAKALHDAEPPWPNGTLFIFDNFEALADSSAIHRFLDTHCHLPNKVLITSRERAFKADFPIEVSGMEKFEAFALMTNAARELRIEGHLTDRVMGDMFNYAEGHAYVLRMLVGEIAKEGRFVPPQQLLPKRLDIIDAVFERSFEKLTYAGRWAFLTVANWRSFVPEVAVVVVLSRHNFDSEAGLEECVRLSLLTTDMMVDGDPCYYAPQLARVFAKKKLDGDPDKLGILEDIQMIQHFGVLGTESLKRTGQAEVIQNYIRWVQAEAKTSSAGRRQQLGSCLEAVAGMYPAAWLEVAKYWELHSPNQTKTLEALRRAVEEMPLNKDAWLKRAEYAKRAGDDSVYLASLISAVDAEPENLSLLSGVALRLVDHLTSNKDAIPKDRRGIYLASVRSKLAGRAGDLDAVGLSRLAWLYLLEDRREEAQTFAERGLERDPRNEHCRKIIDRIKQGRR